MVVQECGVGIMLLVCGYQDIHKKQVSAIVLVLFAAGGVAAQMLFPKLGAADIAAGIIPGILVCGISVFTKGSIGLGDGMVLGISGIYLGVIPVLKIFFYGNILCAVAAGVMWISKKAGRKSTLPFIPFLLLGYLITRIVG